MKNEFNFSLAVQFIKEGKHYVASCPALDIVTQGETLEEAHTMFDELAKIYIDELIEMGTLDDVLVSCGWIKKINQWVPPSIQHITEAKHSVNIPCPT